MRGSLVTIFTRPAPLLQDSLHVPQVELIRINHLHALDGGAWARRTRHQAFDDLHVTESPSVSPRLRTQGPCGSRYFVQLVYRFYWATRDLQLTLIKW